jgi:NitT/TauT family transport system permease protein
MTINLNNIIKDVFTPNKSIDAKLKDGVYVFWILLIIATWFFSGSQYIPTPGQVFDSGKELIVKYQFFNDLLISTTLCFKAIIYASIISLFIAYLSVIPFFKPICYLVGKMRFLTTAGLTFLFAQLTSDTSHQKVALLVFGVTVFLTTGACAIVSSVKKEELDYARTMRMGEWRVTYEVIILGKIDQMLELIRQNFAMAWLMLVFVENICRADGGIGIVLFDQSKHFRLESVYAIQIIVLCTGMILDFALGFLKTKLCPYSVLELEKH